MRLKNFVRNFFYLIMGILTGITFVLLFIFWFVNSAEYVKVPDLSGESVEIAIKVLKNEGLIPIVIGKGEKVLNTDPKSESWIKKGHHIFVILENIEEMILPDFSNIPLNVVIDFLRKWNLNWKIQYIPSNKPEGVVVSTDPASGSKVKENDTIIIKVSK